MAPAQPRTREVTNTWAVRHTGAGAKHETEQVSAMPASVGPPSLANW